MGQTLTHGVYLPDEGERNCYDGLASNWSILDGAVGTIAEHTTALAGKAPLVHTHTKSDITDFPAYGNAAGTICEGNDSRLSDARTPTSHVHGNISNDGKLTNGNRAVITGSDKSVTESSVTDTELGYLSGVTSAIQTQLNAKAADSDVVHKTGNETIAGEKTFSAPCKTLGKKLLANITDLDDAYYNGEVCGFNPNTLHNPTGGHGNVLTINNAVNAPDNIYNSWITQIAAATNNAYLGSRTRTNGGAWTSWTRILTEAYARPTVTNTYDLGTSSYKWKTLNGINPGALSLPGAFEGINNQIKNPSDQLNAIDLNGSNNTWVSDVDCYLYFYIPNNKFTWIRIFWPATLVRCGQTFVPVPNESSDYSGFVPVPANTTVVIQIKGTQAPTFRRSACLGNV